MGAYIFYALSASLALVLRIQLCIRTDTHGASLVLEPAVLCSVELSVIGDRRRWNVEGVLTNEKSSRDYWHYPPKLRLEVPGAGCVCFTLGFP